MRVPLSWLAEYVDLPANVSPELVMAELVKVGLEEEGIHRFEVTGPVVVGQVLAFDAEPQTNGKTIRWCQVRVAPEGAKAADGGADVRGIVCGASNFEVGDKVVVCLPGSALPGDFKIAARSTYGHTSDGMLASARELGLSEDHAGILRLGEIGLDPKVGTDAIELLGLDDQAAEVNVTPDRGYCFSIRGIAREYSHATGADFRDPTGNAHPEFGSGYSLTVEDQKPIREQIGCNRFVVRAVTEIDPNRPTPAWMVARLKLAGMRSISLTVDITNYVMLELGQPTHAYDLDKLSGGISVRRAKAGESLKTLDGQVRKLDPEDLLITDESGPIGLAGVMGGETTEVDSNTTRVLVEAARFDPISIARSARRHKLSSEASKRFERGVDPRLAEFAVARVVQLLEVHAGGVGSSIGADFSALEQPHPLFLPQNFATELVGVSYAPEQVVESLSAIGCVVAHVSDGYEVIPPSWRPDLTHKTDLVEEIARIQGYHLIPSRLPVAPPGRGLTKRQQGRRLVVNTLAAAGHIEVLNYPFVGSAANQWFTDHGTDRVITLANPIQEDAKEMRTRILPGLMDAAKRNIDRGFQNLAIFEEGSVFHPEAPLKKTDHIPVGNELPSAATLKLLNDAVPAQPKHIAGLFTGRRITSQVGVAEVLADYRDAVQAVRVIAKSLGLEVAFVQAQSRGFHPGRCASVQLINGGKSRSVGFVGEVDPVLTRAIDLPRRVAAFELNLDEAIALSPEVISADPIWVMPAATQDLSLVVPIGVAAADLLQVIKVGAGELLEAVELVDDYRGENVAAGHKSLTFALRFRASDRTLTQAEATEAKDQAVALAAEKFGAQQRA
jgi:phenylalanyl-tRNA synthetase beta chain